MKNIDSIGYTCNSSGPYLTCTVDDFECYVGLNGYVSCTAPSANASCDVNVSGIVSCIEW